MMCCISNPIFGSSWCYGLDDGSAIGYDRTDQSIEAETPIPVRKEEFLTI